MKISLALTLLTFAFVNISLAQSSDTLKVNTKAQTINFKKTSISSKTPLTQVVKLLGTPDRVEQAGGKDRHYVYDNLGLAFDLGRGGLIVEAVTITFDNSEQDKKAAHLKFKGVLLVDGFVVTENTGVDTIKEKTELKKLFCIMPSMCMTDTKDLTNMLLLMGYNNKNTITQMVFGFTK